MTPLSDLLAKHQSNFAPLFQPQLTLDNTLMMDFSIYNPEMKMLNFTDIKSLNTWVFDQIQLSGKKYGYGGYMEDREVYRRSPLFDVSPDEARSIHLGIDVWVEAETIVYCPLDAKVHSFANNANYGDYGPTIILEHNLEGTPFYTLYGHLSSKSLEGLSEGKSIAKGEAFCKVGTFPENGDWPPHLHFQVMNSMGEKKGDYPGVCSKKDQSNFRNICPDPKVFFEL